MVCQVLNVIVSSFDHAELSTEDLIKYITAVYFLRDVTELAAGALLQRFWEYFSVHGPRFSPAQYISIIRILDALDYANAFKKDEVLKMTVFLDNFIPDINYDDLEYFCTMLKRRKLLWAGFFHRVVDHYSLHSGAYSGHDLARFAHLVTTTDPDLGDALDKLMDIVSSEVLLRPKNFSVADISLVISACSIANVYVPELFTIFSTRVKADVEQMRKNSFYLGNYEELVGYTHLKWQSIHERNRSYMSAIKERGEPKFLMSDFELIPWHELEPKEFYLPVKENKVKHTFVGSPWRYHLDVFSNLKERFEMVHENLELLARTDSGSKPFIKKIRERIREMSRLLRFPSPNEIVIPPEEFSEEHDPVQEAVDSSYIGFFGKMFAYTGRIDTSKDDIVAIESEKIFRNVANSVISKGYPWASTAMYDRVEYIPLKSKEFSKLDSFARKSLAKRDNVLDDPLESELFFFHLFKGLDLLSNWVEHPEIRGAVDELIPILVANMEHLRTETIGDALVALHRHGVGSNHVAFMKGEITLHQKLDAYETALASQDNLLESEIDGIMRVFRGLSGHDYDISEETADRVLEFASRVPINSRQAAADLLIGLCKFIDRNRDSVKSEGHTPVYAASLATIKQFLNHFTFLAPDTTVFWRHATLRELVPAVLSIRDLVPEYADALEGAFVRSIEHLLPQHRLEVGELAGGFDFIWLIEFLSQSDIPSAAKLRYQMIDRASRSFLKMAPLHRLMLSKIILSQGKGNVPVKELMLVKEILKDCSWNPANLSDGDLKEMSRIFDQYIEIAGQLPINSQEIRKAITHILHKSDALNNDYVPHLLSVFSKHGFKSKEVANELETALMSEDPDSPVKLSKLTNDGLVALLSLSCGSYRDMMDDETRHLLLTALHERISRLSLRERDLIDESFWPSLGVAMGVARNSNLGKTHLDVLRELHSLSFECAFLKPDVYDSVTFQRLAAVESELYELQ